MPPVQIGKASKRNLISLVSVLALSAVFSVDVIAAHPPRLVVMLVIDQFGTNYLNRWRPYLKGGIDTLIRRGAFYPNGVHRYSNTATCPGHASIMTGAWPNIHGVVNNKWIEQDTGSLVTCTYDKEFGDSPFRRMAPSFGDELNEISQGKSKTVTISLKPRVAVISAPKAPTAAVWYDRAQGRFISGKWNKEKKSPDWVNRINRDRNPAMSFGEKWNRFRPKLDYRRLADQDNRPYEFDVPGLGRVFPKKYGQGLEGPNEKWLGNYRGTPHALESTFALAKAAIKEEKLGEDKHVDFLMVGVSNLDLIGHWYGPHSQEALDMVLRIDQEIKELIRYVEKRSGRGNVLWVLTADHGVVSIPEASQKFGLQAKRVDTPALKKFVNDKLRPLTKKGKKPSTVAVIDPPFVVLNHGQTKVDRTRVREVAVKALQEHPDIAEAFLTEEIHKMKEPYRTMYERMIYPNRSSDIMVRSHPHDWIDPGNWTTGTGHGSPYNYDTHVPIIIAGPGVTRGHSSQTYDVTRIVPTISALLNMTAPAAALDPPLPAAGQ